MNKKYLALIGMVLAVGFTQPIYAEETTAATEVSSLTPEAFTAQYSDKMNELIELAKGDIYTLVTDKMKEDTYIQMVNDLPYDGFCYPVTNGDGLKIFKDYMYYGTLANGQAEGNGKMFRIYSNTITPRYGMFTGNWHNDAPNGTGEEWSNCIGDSGFKFRAHYMGDFVNWYQDGDMVAEIYFDGGRRTYRYHVTNKVADVIDMKKRKKGDTIPVIAYAEEKSASYLSFLNSAQTALWHPLDDGNLKNKRSLWVAK